MCDITNDRPILMNQCGSNDGGVNMLLWIRKTVVISWLVSPMMRRTIEVNQRVTLLYVKHTQVVLDITHLYSAGLLGSS